MIRAAAENRHEPPAARSIAVAALPLLADFSRELPWLCKLLDSPPDERFRSSVENTIGWAIGEATVPYIAEQIQRHPRRRASLLGAVAGAPWKNFEGEFPRFRPAVLGSLASASPALRLAAVRATLRVCGATAESWVVLHAMLLDPDINVHKKALNEISRAKWATPWHWRLGELRDWLAKQRAVISERGASAP